MTARVCKPAGGCRDVVIPGIIGSNVLVVSIIAWNWHDQQKRTASTTAKATANVSCNTMVNNATDANPVKLKIRALTVGLTMSNLRVVLP